MLARKSFLAVSLVVILGLLASCAPGAVPTLEPTASLTPKLAALTPTPKPPTEQPRYGGILTKSVGADPPSFDLHQEESLAALEPLAPAYDGLVQYDRHSGKIVGALAEKWEVSPDGLVYTFYLHKGVKWHDGKPFSSEDVRYSLQRQKDPPKGVRSARKEQFELVEIEAPDENTIKIVMKQPQASFLAQFATDWTAVLPKHVLEDKGDMKKVVMGTGAFKLQEYSIGVIYKLVKNPDYFMKGLPYLDGIAQYVIKDAATRFSAFRTGRVKMTSYWIPLTPSEATVIRAEYPHLLVWEYPVNAFPRHPMNTSRPPFNDVRVRRAVSLAYDRQAAIKVLELGRAKLGTFLPQGQWGLPEQDILKLPGYRQPKDEDRAAARKLLAEAGYPNGFKMTILARAKDPDPRVAEFMQNQLATIGIDASVEVAEVAVYFSRLLALEFQMGTQQGRLRQDDPGGLSPYFVTGAGQSYGKWSVKKFDELLLEQSRTLDVAKRRAMAREMDEILLQELPSILPYWKDYLIGTWPEVRNFASPPNGESGMRLHDIWLAKER